MRFASLKAQNRRIGGWNWPQITRIKQIFADFSNRRPERQLADTDENISRPRWRGKPST